MLKSGKVVLPGLDENTEYIALPWGTDFHWDHESKHLILSACGKFSLLLILSRIRKKEEFSWLKKPTKEKTKTNQNKPPKQP